MKILVVEDQKHEFLMVSQVLQKNMACEVSWVKRGREAISHLTQHASDISLLDYNLPDMNGLEVFKEMQSLQPDLPVVFVTGEGNEETAVSALKSGAYDYIVKDVSGHYLDRIPNIIESTYKRNADQIARRIAEQELREREKELQITVQKLKKRNEELDAFAHTVAHDLRAPLALITGYSSLLNENLEMLTAEQSRRAIRTLVETSHKIDSIIDSLLLLAGTRNQSIEMSPIDMKEVVHEAINRMAYRINDADAIITIQKDLPGALGHAPWIEEVWANYISNAIKYGGKPPCIEIGATLLNRKNHVRYFIKDNGEGMTKSQTGRLFTPFERLNKQQKRGAGLGLTIVERIISRCDGTVGIHSARGRGSTFWFTLPRANA